MQVVDINGNHLRTIKTSMYPYDYLHNKEGKLLLYLDKKPFQNKPFSIIGYDEKAVSFYGFLPSNGYERSGFGFHPFSENFIGSFFAQFANDTIYNIDSEIAHPSYVLDFGKRSLPADKRDIQSVIKMMNGKEQFLCLSHSWKQVGQIVSFVYCSEERLDNLLYYDLKTDLFYGGRWNYPEMELGRIYGPNQGSTEDSFVFLVQAISIIEDADKYQNKRSGKYLKLASSLDVEDNPVIVFWKVAE